MKTHDVTLTPAAKNDLVGIYEYIANKSQMPEVAWAYMQRLETACHGLKTAPLRGQKRDDLRKNLRITPLDKNAVAAFEVDEKEQTVTVLNIFYGGRDYDAIMSNT